MRLAPGVVVLLLVPGQVSAQDQAAPARVEVWGGVASMPPAPGGTLDVRYAPVLQLGGTPLDSSARQQLAIDTRRGHGLDLGVNVYVTRRFGAQVAFLQSSAGVTGAAGTYDSHLRYRALPPPSHQPQEFTYDRTSDWSRASGTLRRRSLVWGGVGRWRAGPDVGGTIAGGLVVDWYSDTDEIESVAYTQFVLGGHSTLFPVTHRVAMAPVAGARTTRPYVAGDVHRRVSSGLAVFGGVRVTLGAVPALSVGAARLVDPTENPWAPELADVRTTLGTQELELPSADWRLIVGAKVSLLRH